MSMTFIKYRAESKECDFAGRTVQELRQAYEHVLGIPQDAAVLVNGKDADPDYKLADGDKVEFIKSGPKYAPLAA